MNARLLSLLLLCGVLLVGCKPDADTDSGEGTVSKEPQLPELEGNVEAQIASWEEVEQAVADKAGKVVVVDVWSTWCEPCKKEFPGLVKLQRMHKDDVVAMSVNMNYAGLDDDDLEKIRQEALTFLEEVGAKFPNFVSSTPDTEVYEKIETVGVPVVLIYGRDGQLSRRFDIEAVGGREFTYEGDIIPFVQKLLAK